MRSMNSNGIHYSDGLPAHPIFQWSPLDLPNLEPHNPEDQVDSDQDSLTAWNRRHLPVASGKTDGDSGSGSGDPKSGSDAWLILGA